MKKGLSSLFFSYDEHPRTKKGRPRGGSITENTINLSVPPCLKRVLEAGSFVDCMIFMVPV
jgi:hypothetical protein